MKRLLLFLLLFVLPSLPLYLYRQRIYLWDLIARVERDGSHVQRRVFINASNDIFFEDGIVLQRGMPAPALASPPLRCWLRSFCIASSDTVPVNPAGYDAHPAMTSRNVQWTDEQHRTWLVRLF